MLVSARGWRGRERKGAEKEKEQRKKRNKTASHKSSLGIPASHFKGRCSLSRMEWAKVNHHMTFPMAGKPNCQNYTPQTVYGHIWVHIYAPGPATGPPPSPPHCPPPPPVVWDGSHILVPYEIFPLPPLWCGGGVALSPSPPCGVVGVWYGMVGMYGVYGRSGMACLESMVCLVCMVGMVCMA